MEMFNTVQFSCGNNHGLIYAKKHKIVNHRPWPTILSAKECSALLSRAGCQERNRNSGLYWEICSLQTANIYVCFVFLEFNIRC